MLSILTKGLIIALIGNGALVGLLYADIVSRPVQIGVGLVWLAICFAFVNFLRKSILFIVTPNSVRKDSGIINRKREEMNVKKVQSIDVQQNLVERFVFRTGRIFFCSASTDVSRDDIVFSGVVDPHAVADIVRGLDHQENYPGGSSQAYRAARGLEQNGHTQERPQSNPAQGRFAEPEADEENGVLF